MLTTKLYFRNVQKQMSDFKFSKKVHSEPSNNHAKYRKILFKISYFWSFEGQQN